MAIFRPLDYGMRHFHYDQMALYNLLFTYRPQVKSYTVTVERTQDPLSPHSGTSSPPSFPQPPRTTTTSTIFDSDTIPLSDELPTTKGQLNSSHACTRPAIVTVMWYTKL